MKMKPLPKFILLGTVVAVAGYGISVFLDSRKSATPVVETTPVVQNTTGPNSPAVTNVQGAVNITYPAVEAAPVSAPAPSSTDSGLDSVLKAAASKKK